MKRDCFDEHFNYDFGYGEIDPCYHCEFKRIAYLAGELELKNNDHLN